MIKGFMTAIVAVAVTIGLAGALQAPVVNADPPANNGTLKVHEEGSPIGTAPVPGTENNQPKVCRFNFEGFFFDASQEGYLEVVTQGGGPIQTLVAGPLAVTADTNGYYVTGDYFNDEDGPVINDGLYKVTWYIKDLPQSERDEKAKSKVFKVECVRAEAPSFMDRCGTANDTFTIPESSGVEYKVDGVVKPAGTYPGVGTVTVTAVAKKGALAGATSWSHTFTNGACAEPARAIIAARLFCDATTRMFTLEVSNSGTANANVSVNGMSKEIVMSTSQNFEIGVDNGSGVTVDLLVDGKHPAGSNETGFDGSRTFFANGIKNCQGGGTGNGKPVATVGTPSGSGAIVESLPVTSSASDKIAALAVMIGSIVATAGGYALRARGGELSI